MSHDGYHAASFPAPGYARHILEPAFRAAQAHLFGPMLLSTRAHLVMLAEQGILTSEQAGRLLAAVREAESAGPESYRYDPAVEDLYFAIERRVIERCGPNLGGSLPLARSRNDLDGAMARISLRQRLLRVSGLTLLVRERLAALARRHVDTLIPGVTHTQEAQPTTLAHYLLGVLGPLNRDGERLQLAYRHTNQSPLGVAAFTTTGLPISRERTAELLGFDGLVENGYDAVGAADYMLEAVAAFRTMCASLVRFVNDLLIWARSDVGVVRVGDEFIQISSIMPQKRNPVVLEHIRARIGYVFGDAATVEAMVHTAAFGDTVDVEDEIYVPLFRCCDSVESVLALLADVLATIRFDTARLAERAAGGFGTATELAERLTIDFNLPYRQAHGAVARIVRELSAEGRDLRSLTPEQVERAVAAGGGPSISVGPDQLRGSTDPAAFVDRRTVPGGPAPATVRAAIERDEARQRALRSWVEERQAALSQAQDALDRRVEELVQASAR